MKRHIASIGAALGLVTSLANPSIGTWTATLHAPVPAVYCPGAEDLGPADISYDFGSSPLADSMGGISLSVIQPYNKVTFTGAVAVFNNYGLLASKPFANLNLGTHDFAMCTLWEMGSDPDHAYNLSQINNNPGATGTNGHVKMMPGYCLFIASGGKLHKASVLTHGASKPGYHPETCARRGDTFYSYLDGVLSEKTTVPGFGSIDLGTADQLCIGSKCTTGHNDVTSEDMWTGRIAYDRVVVK